MVAAAPCPYRTRNLRKVRISRDAWLQDIIMWQQASKEKSCQITKRYLIKWTYSVKWLMRIQVYLLPSHHCNLY